MCEFRGRRCMRKWTPWMKKSQPLPFAQFPKNLFLNSALSVLFIKKWIPMEEATQAYCLHSKLHINQRHGLYQHHPPSFSCSLLLPAPLSVLKLNLSYSEGKIKRVSREGFLACWVKRTNVELSSRAELHQKDMTCDPRPDLWTDTYKGQRASWPGISLFCITILYRLRHPSTCIRNIFLKKDIFRYVLASCPHTNWILGH